MVEDVIEGVELVAALPAGGARQDLLVCAPELRVEARAPAHAPLRLVMPVVGGGIKQHGTAIAGLQGEAQGNNGSEEE